METTVSPPERRPAPGGPGIEPRWTSSDKSGVGTAFDDRSLVWFTISHGIVDEVYWPRADQANTRDFGLLVCDAGASADPDYFSEEKRDTKSTLYLLSPGVQGYRLVNTCDRGRYEIDKSIITDPERDVLVQRIRFRPLIGKLEDYRVFALLAPHIGNQGYRNHGWCEDYKGTEMLFARREGVSMALACTCGWRARSCGYVGVNDGWRQVNEHHRLVDEYTEATDGNVALTGEIDLSSALITPGKTPIAEFVLALAFGAGPAEAAQRARMTLTQSFDRIAEEFVLEWRAFHERTQGPKLTNHCVTPEEMRETAERDVASGAHAASDGNGGAPAGDPRAQESTPLPPCLVDLYWTSAAVLACHEDKRAFGALIASLSIPWGQAKGDHELGGYHLVWPRDLVECAGGLLAAGHPDLTRRTLRYLMSIQDPDGRWPQNSWLDGTPYWQGSQMDETGFPILFAELLRRENELDDLDPWPMIAQAAGFIVRHGPVTEQDRWEEQAGYSPFTLAVEIAALVVAADFADQAGERRVAEVLRDAADAWNDDVERWTYVTGTDLAKRVGVAGYYARIAPPNRAEWNQPRGPDDGYIPIRNQPPGRDRARYEDIVSPDALALVRFGLRSASDERIINTVRVIDTVARRRTKTGPVWYRYNNDGYGEHQDGSPFDGLGVGRGWPLLAGERGHYELARGRTDVAMSLLGVMRAQTTDGGMLPEQVWDADDIPERGLVNGRASNGAMPLAWAHAEYVKLVRSLHDGAIFDLPDAPYERYVRRTVRARHAFWSTSNRTCTMRAGRVLRIHANQPVLVRWTADGWQTSHDAEAESVDSLRLWIADLDTTSVGAGTAIDFKLFYPREQRWEGQDYRVAVE